MTAFIMMTAFNAHGSEHNLINAGRIEGETIRNDNEKKRISKAEEIQYMKTQEKNAENRRPKAKVKLAKAPWE